MPRVSKKSFSKKRRVVRRRKQRTVNVNRALNPIPQRYITKMKYSADVSTAATGLYAFNINSVFDPDRSGIGHQPYGHDTLSTLYNRYRVIATGWRITAPSSTQVVQLAALPSNEVLTTTTMDYYRENPRCKYFCQNLGGRCELLKSKVYLPSLVGRNTAQYMADDRFQAQVGNNPAELAVLNIFTAGGAGLPAATPINILIEFTVEWFDLINLAQS